MFKLIYKIKNISNFQIHICFTTPRKTVFKNCSRKLFLKLFYKIFL